MILAGVRSVTLLDPEPARVEDLSAQFFLSNDSLGKRRDECCLAQLSELNEYVPVSVLRELDDIAQLIKNADLIQRFQAVIVTEQTLPIQLAINEMTHAANVAYIQADVRGLCAQVFCDFGKDFVILDATGEVPVIGLVGGITQEVDGVVTCAEDARHGLEDGDYVTFREVRGMTQLNGCEPRKVVVKGPFTFSIGDTSNFSAYESSGVFEQTKQSKKLSFLPLKDALNVPRFVVSDFAKIDRQGQLHAAFEALSLFQQQQHRLPRPRDTTDATLFYQLAREVATNRCSDVTIDEKFICDLSYSCAGHLAPMCAVIGGLVAQEVLKACSGKFHPIDQFFYFDALECLPHGDAIFDRAPPSDFQPIGNRYDAQIAVFGRQFQERLSQLNGFVVGAGAIGCELLKLFALMGVSSQGVLHVTDMDTIEKSNLNRQFLFRPWDVSKPKSQTAAEAAIRLNPDLTGHINSRLDRVGPETEEIFGDAFYENLDFVANALDNMEARKYVDRRCVFYRKPLLESGTLGTKGNTQVVIPYLTESYSSSQDPPEKTIPFCTLHNFPNSIEHTIQWAMDAFHGLFRVDPETANIYLNAPNDFKQNLLTPQGQGQKERLEKVINSLITERPISYEACVAWARLKFEEFFSNSIKQLLFNFPHDAKTSSGAAFWSGPKRIPTPLSFDPENSTHLSFVMAAANLRAENYGLKGSNDVNLVKSLAGQVMVPEFQPKSGITIQVSENDPAVAKTTTMDAIDDIEEYLYALPDPTNFVGFRLHPIEFEKDDDTNWHVSFVAATANLRATNYEITNTDRHVIKQIAGKIIPAIATTTAVVAGLAGLELYKLVAGPRNLERFKNGFVNLALPFTGFSEPIAAPKSHYGEHSWTLWDRFDVEGDLTLGELLEWFRTKHQLIVGMLSYGSSMLYGYITNKQVLAERLQLPMSKLIESVSRKAIPPYANSLQMELLAEDLEGNDVEVPYLLVKLR